MKCNECGFNNSIDSKRCSLCDSTLETPSEINTGSKRTSLSWKPVYVILVLIVISAFSLYKYQRPQHEQNLAKEAAKQESIIQAEPVPAAINSTAEQTTVSRPKPDNSQIQKITIPESIEQHVQKMLEGAMNNDENIIQTNKQYLENQPKPPKGDRKIARKINEEALKYSQAEQYDQALPLLAKAAQIDTSDVEILNNYGFVLMKSRHLDGALLVLTKTLAIKPDRASAWANLADVLALQGHVDLATAGYLNVFRFSKNKENTYKFFQNSQLQEDSPYVREAIANAIQKISL